MAFFLFLAVKHDVIRSEELFPLLAYQAVLSSDDFTEIIKGFGRDASAVVGHDAPSVSGELNLRRSL